MISRDTKKYLKELEIVFENCDSVVISGDYINNLYLGDIVKSIRMFCSKKVGNYQIAKDVYICISDKLKDENLLTEFKDNAWKRLSEKDITQLHLTYSDDSKEMFFVDWNEDKEFSNDYQLVKFERFSFDRMSLVISINRQNRDKKIIELKKSRLIDKIDIYSKYLSNEILTNSKNLINQLKVDYFPDEIYITKESEESKESNNRFLRFNWFRDNLDIFMADIYSDRIEIKIYTRLRGYILENSFSFVPDKINLNDVIDKGIRFSKGYLSYLDLLWKLDGVIQ